LELYQNGWFDVICEMVIPQWINQSRHIFDSQDSVIELVIGFECHKVKHWKLRRTWDCDKKVSKKQIQSSERNQWKYRQKMENHQSHFNKLINKIYVFILSFFFFVGFWIFLFLIIHQDILKQNEDDFVKKHE